MLQKYNPKNADIIVHVGGQLLPRKDAKVSVFDSVVQGGERREAKALEQFLADHRDQINWEVRRDLDAHFKDRLESARRLLTDDRRVRKPFLVFRHRRKGLELSNRRHVNGLRDSQKRALLRRGFCTGSLQPPKAF